jgi:hypothetical protein
MIPIITYDTQTDANDKLYYWTSLLKHYIIRNAGERIWNKPGLILFTASSFIWLLIFTGCGS